MSEIQCRACGTTNRIPADKAHRVARCGRCHAPLALEPTIPRVVTDASFEHDVLRSPLPVLLGHIASTLASELGRTRI
jgi:thioredoxin 2